MVFESLSYRGFSFLETNYIEYIYYFSGPDREFERSRVFESSGFEQLRGTRLYFQKILFIPTEVRTRWEWGYRATLSTLRESYILYYLGV